MKPVMKAVLRFSHPSWVSKFKSAHEKSYACTRALRANQVLHEDSRPRHLTFRHILEIAFAFQPPRSWCLTWLSYEHETIIRGGVEAAMEDP